MPALEALLKLSPAFGNGGDEASGSGAIGKEFEEDFTLLQERCNDVSLSTRKVGRDCRLLVLMQAVLDLISCLLSLSQMVS